MVEAVRMDRDLVCATLVTIEALKTIRKEVNGRGKRIRTSGPCLPKTVLYQAELFPDRAGTSLHRQDRRRPIGAAFCAGKHRIAFCQKAQRRPSLRKLKCVEPPSMR